MDEDLKQLIESTAAQTARQFEELYERLDGVAVELGTRLDGVDGRLDGLDGRLDGLDAKMDSVAAETRLHFDITAAGLRRDMAAVIEGMANVDERLTREANDIRSEMRDRFADTDALIKYAYTKLDRRLGILEESVQ